MLCAYRCQWFEKSDGVEHADGYSYALRREALELWIEMRSNPTFSEVATYRASQIEIVLIDPELAKKIFKYRVYNCDVCETNSPPDLGSLSRHKVANGSQ